MKTKTNEKGREENINLAGFTSHVMTWLNHSIERTEKGQDKSEHRKSYYNQNKLKISKQTNKEPFTRNNLVLTNGNNN